MTGLTVDFAKKARGSLVATGSASAPALEDIREAPVACLARAEIRDAEEEIVATVVVEWKVGAQPPD